MLRLAFIILLCATPALSQEQSTATTRLSMGFGRCLGFLEERNDQVFDLQKRLDIAEEELKKLKEKSDAKQIPGASQDNGGSGTQP